MRDTSLCFGSSLFKQLATHPGFRLAATVDDAKWVTSSLHQTDLNLATRGGSIAAIHTKYGSAICRRPLETDELATTELLDDEFHQAVASLSGCTRLTPARCWYGNTMLHGLGTFRDTSACRTGTSTRQSTTSFPLRSFCCAIVS